MDNDAELIINELVNSFLKRNPDITRMIARDCLVAEHLQPETIIAIKTRISQSSEYRNG